VGRRPEFLLSEESIRQLQARYDIALKENDLAVFRRVRALLLVGRDGYTRADAALAVGVEESVLYRWQQRFRRHGVEGMATRKAPGKKSRLSEEQLEHLADLIAAGPESSGLDTGCWTAPIVSKLIKKVFKEDYSAPQVRRLLRKLSFSYQVPKKRLALADKEKQQQWSEERFPALLKKAADEDAEIFFRMSQFSNSQEQSPGLGQGWVKGAKFSAPQSESPQRSLER